MWQGIIFILQPIANVLLILFFHGLDTTTNLVEVK